MTVWDRDAEEIGEAKSQMCVLGCRRLECAVSQKENGEMSLN